MSASRRRAGLLAATLVLAAACGGAPQATSTSPPAEAAPASPGSPGLAAPLPTGPGSAAGALARLCRRPPVPTGTVAPREAPSPAILEVVQQVETVRGLRFTEPVAAEPVTEDELVDRIREGLDRSHPMDLMARRSRAWQVIGVIPPGASIREAVFEYASTQVIGFYEPRTGELVFVGTDDPTPLERLTLVHELTHALDDQHFDLDRLQELEDGCRDEALAAGLAVVEGSAELFSFRVVQRFFSLKEQLALLGVQVPPVGDVSRFVQELLEWPHLAGLEFALAVFAEGGVPAVNRALESLPASTEQVLHPDRYPDDLPQPIDIPDIGPELGAGWADLDVMEVGEAWLAALFRLRLDDDRAARAAEGWDGGLYRAWTDGRGVAVVLSTVWDTAEEAEEFGRAMRDWLASDERAAVLEAPTGVPGVAPAEAASVLFASDRGTLTALRSALER